MQNAGLKPPPVVTPAEEKKDLDRRIAEIQNDPNIRDETKRRSIDMMRATSGQSSDAPSGSGGRPKTTK